MHAKIVYTPWLSWEYMTTAVHALLSPFCKWLVHGSKGNTQDTMQQLL